MGSARLNVCLNFPRSKRWSTIWRRHAVSLLVGRFDVAVLSVLKTVDRPVDASRGQTVAGAGRWSKYLGLQADTVMLIAHLLHAGWLRRSNKLAAASFHPGSRADRAAHLSGHFR